MRLAAGLRSDQLKKLTALPRPVTWIKGDIEIGEGGKGGSKTVWEGKRADGDGNLYIAL